MCVRRQQLHQVYVAASMLMCERTCFQAYGFVFVVVLNALNNLYREGRGAYLRLTGKFTELLI